jgi:hypothetical protein
MKDALNENTARIEAGPNAPTMATCPACRGVVVLRSRRYGRESKKTWFYRHRRGEGPRCLRRTGAGR